MIGNVEVKNRSVHFYVFRKGNFVGPGGTPTLTFDEVQLNVGGAMNLKTGEFTAPVNGTYHFEFNCLKEENDPKKLSVYLKVDRLESGTSSVVASTHVANVSNHVSGSLTASLRLKSRDKVYLAIYGRGELFDNYWARYTQFVGWLVEEDLAL